MTVLRPLTLISALALCAAVLSALAAEEAYDPKIDPAEFTAEITHPLFSMPAGKTMVYKAKTEDGEERTEIRIRGETRDILGVETLVYNDRVFLDGQLQEETYDYIAQDKSGNVWYFGEEADQIGRASCRERV